MARRKVEQPPTPGAPLWMNTYGDMVTLVLTFFVLLFSFSTVDAVKWEELVQSFTGTRITIIEPLDPNLVGVEWEPVTEDVTDEITDYKFNELYEYIKEYIVDNKLDFQLGVSKNDDEILLRIKDSVLFDSGRSDIKPIAYDILNEVSRLLDEYDPYIEMVQIEGHTDSDPIVHAKFKDNWDLSMNRAYNVLMFVIEHSGMEPEKYTFIGRGEYRPVASNETEEGKAQNRRVDFIIRSKKATLQDTLFNPV